MKNNLEIIANSFKENLNKVRVFDNSMGEDQVKLRNLALEIRALKNENPDLKPADIKDKLHAFEVIGSDLSLKEQDLRKYVIIAVEYYTLCRVLGIELEISEEETKAIEYLVANSPTLFVAEKDKVEVLNKDLYEHFLGGLADKINDPVYLDKIFNAPVFSQQIDLGEK